MKFKKQGLDEWMGTLGFLVAIAVFFGTGLVWEPIASILSDLGVQVHDGAAGERQQKMVGAVFAFAALGVLLAVQFMLSRRQDEGALQVS